MRTVSCLALLLVLGANSLTAQIWDAAADYDGVQNPNGAWSYGESGTLGGPFSAFTATGGFCGNITGWESSTGSFAFPAIARVSPAGTQCCTTVRGPAGTVLMHPGSAGQYAVLRWTAPASGTYEVRVGFGGADFSFPTSSDVGLLHNGTPLFTDDVNSFDGPTSCSSASYGIAAGSVQLITVAAGDTLDAVVGFGINGTFNGDSTIVDMTVVLAGSTNMLGSSCGSLTTVLSASPPVLGGPTTLSLTGAPPLTAGVLFVSAPVPPVNLGAGCTVYVNVAPLVPFVNFGTDGFGNWSQTVVVPAVPGLSGTSLVLQGFLFPAPTPLGYVLTNGLAVTL